MPPKKLNKDGDQKSKEDEKSNKPTVSDEEVRQESGKAANAALAAQKKAKELKDAAAAAGDPEERERLTEEATNAEIEAESFGKTAKYLRSGAFQGMAMGTGLGVAPGATLGAISGTLVGGISSTLLGGLGAGIGGVTGAIHGPFVNMGKVAGKGMKKLTSFLPEWAASEEQKRTLEKMVSQAKDEEMPGAEELEKFKSEGGGGQLDEGWLQNAKGMLPKQEDVSDAAKAGAQATSGESVPESKDGTSEQQPHEGSAQTDGPQGRKKPRKLNSRPTDVSSRVPDTDGNDNTKDEPTQSKQGSDAHKEGETDEQTKRLNQREADLNRKEAELDQREKALEKREKELESRSTSQGPEHSTTSEPKGHPRKLETRS
ncbi:hypothetical protein COCVIDRAFT_108752 [Bipolaris victoriae FI3]|uniref:Glycine zipper domain-containing protein n=1 Tax=Bipolaris victoriae (strain FI3) TaxID=930091 RepID=W7DZF2_BIPV3|nr:hypothetical protein COCVIDRAFT_108752 [Bipolaris victoriae FI3]